jgi:hypothetical protein
VAFKEDMLARLAKKPWIAESSEHTAHFLIKARITNEIHQFCLISRRCVVG